MGRRKLAYLDPVGRVNVRLIIPQVVWALAIRVGHAQTARTQLFRVNSDDRAGMIGMTLLMKGIEELFDNGDAKWLPDRDFALALSKVADENYGTIPSPGSTIDLTKLHKNPKLKSGFHGVYANGQGFRAMGRDFAGKAIVIGTFKTSEEAAHRRMTYYRTNNLAYGELEEEMERWRADVQQWGVPSQATDEELIRQIRSYHDSAGTTERIFGPNCVSFEPATSKKLPKRAEVAQRAPWPMLTTKAAATHAQGLAPEPPPEDEPIDAPISAIGFDNLEAFEASLGAPTLALEPEPD